MKAHDSNRDDAVFFSVELNTQYGQVRGKVRVESGPMRLAELVPTAQMLTDILAERAVAQKVREGLRVTCERGCGVCCTQMVPLSPPEALYLVDLIDALDPASQSVVLSRIDAIIRVLERKSMINDFLRPEYFDDLAMSIAKEYFSLKMPCPFLDANICTIYPYRPVACREYNVTTPAEWCNDPYSHHIEKIPMPAPLSEPLAHLTASLTGMRPRLIPLVIAPRWSGENRSIVGRQWPGADLFCQFMAYVHKVPQKQGK